MSNTTFPQTIKNNNRSKNRDFNIFTEEYFGGSDVFVYIDGKREHNIAAIQYSVQEQHKPIYGYGSRTFDDLAVGNRIVTRAIRIPVKNTDSSSFSDTWGKTSSSASSRAFVPQITVPSWVYNYTPEKINSTVAIENEDGETVSVVARVQEGLGLEANGFIDENTRNAINEYRKNNEMLLGTVIDNELLSNLGIEDYNCYANGRIKLYDSPLLNNSICTCTPNQ